MTKKELQKEVEETIQIVGLALKELRRHSNMTYLDLNRETGVNPHTIKDLENYKGKQGVSIKSLFTLMAYFNYYQIK